MLTNALAEQIVSETMQRLNRNINMMDKTGTIIASGDPSRLGQYHEAAAAAIRHDRTIVIGKEQLHRWRGAQPGVNIPIHYDGQVIGAIGISGDPEEVEPLGQLINMATELLVKQHYAKLHDEWLQSTSAWIVEALLESKPSAPALVDARLRLIHFALKPPYRVIVVYFSFFRKRTDESILHKVRQIMEGSKVLISHYRPQRLILLSSETKLEEIARILNQLVSRLRDEPEIETCFVGVGSPVESREGIPASYREAESALRFGNRNRGAILFYEDVEGQALTHAIPDEYKRRLIAKTAPKLSDKMSQTLTCYFECNFNLAAAAEQLGVHRNTLIYRLDKIKQITGYDPQRFRDAFLLQLVLWWKQAEADSSFLDR